MRYLKTAGAAALAVMALALSAGGAGASALTQAPPFTGTVKAESEGAISMDGSVMVSCLKSALEWSIEEHGASTPTGGPLSAFTLEECGKDTVTIFNRGRFGLHATSGGDGTMTWSNAEITAQLHRTVLGFPITTHCIYKTNNTDIGTFTGSATTKATAKLEIGSSPIPQVKTDAVCADDAILTGTYTFTSPDYLDVD